jgi:hypothetical protein
MHNKFALKAKKGGGKLLRYTRASGEDGVSKPEALEDFVLQNTSSDKYAASSGFYYLHSETFHSITEMKGFNVTVTIREGKVNSSEQQQFITKLGDGKPPATETIKDEREKGLLVQKVYSCFKNRVPLITESYAPVDILEADETSKASNADDREIRMLENKNKSKQLKEDQPDVYEENLKKVNKKKIEAPHDNKSTVPWRSDYI